MKLKNIIFLTGMVLPVSSAFAQYTEDALRFSQTEQGTTARLRGLGGAQTAVGGDLSSLASNPAGLGLFTKSEFNFTPEFLNNSTSSDYYNSRTVVQKDKGGINQVGLVIYGPQRRLKGQDLEKGLLSINFGASYNKTNNFNATVDYGAQNPVSSFADYLSDLANSSLANGAPINGQSPLPAGSLEDMGFNNFLIEYDPDGYFPTTQLNNNQRNVTYFSGSQSDVNFGVASNYNNQLYLGISIGLSSLQYNADREFTEAGQNRTFTGQDPNFTGGTYRLAYRSNQSTEGSGINVKLGLIYRLAPAVRFGFSFISPTWYNLSDQYSEVLDTYYNRSNGSAILPAYTNDDEIYDLDYNLRTPYRVNGGLAFTISKMALLTGDVEYVDYASMNFSTSSYEVSNNTTADIRDMYKGAVNVKLGGEVKLNPITVRLGYNRTGNPYQHLDYDLDMYTAGLGYRNNNFYVDLAYTNTVDNYQTRPYVISESYNDYPTTGSGSIANIKNTRNNVYATIGFRF